MTRDERRTAIIVKSDKELATECREVLDALVGKMAEMRARGLVVVIGMDNGAQSNIVKVTMFKVDKEIENFHDAPPQGPQR